MGPGRNIACAFTLIGCLCLGGASADRASAAGGDLTQKPGAARCYSVIHDCMPSSMPYSPTGIDISPDGSRLFAAWGNGVTVFDRSADGALEEKPPPGGCVKRAPEPDPAGCVNIDAVFSNMRDAALSNDGKSLYVTADASIVVFDVGEDGSITQKPGLAGCVSTNPGCTPGTAMSNGFGGGYLAVSPDDKQVFRSDPHLGSLAIFTRAEDGSLTQGTGPAGCFTATGTPSCAFARSLGGTSDVAVSPDGKSVYVSSADTGSVAVFDRDANGLLSQKPSGAGCISTTEAMGCTAGRGLAGAFKLSVSSDGRSVYVASRTANAVAVFNRSPNGALTQPAGTAGCVASDASEGCATARALEGAISPIVSPDLASVYVTSFTGASMASFDRAANGALVQKPGPLGCIAKVERDGCATDSVASGTTVLAIPPDGRNLYMGGDRAILAFDRELPDTAKPVISALKVTPVRFKAAKKGPSVARSGKGRVSFRLSEAATVRFTFERAVLGRRAGKRCVKPTRANRAKKRCTRFVRQRGAFGYAGKAGANAFRFTGRLRGRTLKPGRLRLTAVATDPAGNRSAPARKGFQLRRR